MSGIYIHIPFCKQACHYCDFHFSTSMQKKDEMVWAIAQELVMRKTEFDKQTVETIYFGGGTPSVLSVAQIEFLFQTIRDHYKVAQNPEITLEANPDDLSEALIIGFSKTAINRLSIGVQSFFETDLQLMHRAHNAEQAKKSLRLATQYFDNISIDLIYGIPGLTNENWRTNINTALSFGVPHISSYALTVEPKTALSDFIKKGKLPKLDDDQASEQFDILMETLESKGFVHYELSNFGKENYFSQNNSAYWLGKKYLGIGPSAHSFDGANRSWNVSNNNQYLKAIQNHQLPSETEKLTKTDCYNEYIMTGLRTIWGVSLEKIKEDFGTIYFDYLQKQAQKFIKEGLLETKENHLKTTKKGKFLTDGMAADLFFVN